jgi:hypothetical protein
VVVISILALVVLTLAVIFTLALAVLSILALVVVVVALLVMLGTAAIISILLVAVLPHGGALLRIGASGVGERKRPSASGRKPSNCENRRDT